MVFGQNVFPLTKNSTTIIDGGNINMIKPVTTGGWARGISLNPAKETERFAGIGAYGISDDN